MDDGCQMHYIDEELERDHAEYIFEKQELGRSTIHTTRKYANLQV